MSCLSLSKIRSLLVIVALTLLAPGGANALAAPGPSIAALRAVGAAEVQDVFVRAPVAAPADLNQPLQVLFALHGMGGNGADFGSALAKQADAHGWLIVAPTIGYGDWTDPAQITREDPALVAWLSDYVRQLADRTGYAVAPRVLIFGHSRGGGTAILHAAADDRVAPVRVANPGLVRAVVVGPEEDQRRVLPREPGRWLRGRVRHRRLPRMIDLSYDWVNMSTGNRNAPGWASPAAGETR